MLRLRYELLLAAFGLAALVAEARAVRTRPLPARAFLRAPLPQSRFAEFVSLEVATMTYCPGPGCALEKKAKAECRLLEGVFRAEPDFTCTFGAGTHRIVCDDVDDEHQCGHMSRTDLEYARAELRLYWEAHQLPHVDVDADEREGLYRCTETRRRVRCVFSDRETKEQHPNSPIECEFDGCHLFGDPPDR